MVFICVFQGESVFRFNKRSSGSRGLLFLSQIQSSFNHAPVAKKNMHPAAQKPAAQMSASAEPLPKALATSRDMLRELAHKYIWWLTPEEALEFPIRIVCQAMNIGLFDDVARLADAVGEEALRYALTHAEAGQFNARSWHYWHYRLGVSKPGQVPSMPVKTIPE